jgi:hypothetical protein
LENDASKQEDYPVFEIWFFALAGNTFFIGGLKKGFNCAPVLVIAALMLPYLFPVSLLKSGTVVFAANGLFFCLLYKTQ